MNFKIKFTKQKKPASYQDICGYKGPSIDWRRNIDFELKRTEAIEFYPNFFFVFTQARWDRFEAIMDYDGLGKPSILHWFYFIKYGESLEERRYLQFPIGESQIEIIEMTDKETDEEWDRYYKWLEKVMKRTAKVE
jgi:hypothetical protein